MKILWLTTSSMSLEPIVRSLEDFLRGDGEIAHERFDVGDSGSVGFNINKMAEKHEPQIILYAGPANGPYLPTPESIRMLRDKAPIVNIICDGGCTGSHKGIEAFQKQESFTFHVNIDGMTNWPYTSNDITTLCPISLSYYPDRPKGAEVRDVELGFYGGNGHVERRNVIAALGDKLQTGTRNEKYGSYQDYADFMRRCRYVINMHANGGKTGSHCKARVVETALAVGCLLEEANSPISQYFKPGVDYIEWKDSFDIERILKETPEETRIDIANSLHKQVMLRFSSIIFWGKVFDKISRFTTNSL